MDSRSRILDALRKQMKPSSPVEIHPVPTNIVDPVSKFKEVLVSIGGHVAECADYMAIKQYVDKHFDPQIKIFTPITDLGISNAALAPRFEDAGLVILSGQLGVAENGAVWLTNHEITDRVMPFITQQLMVVVDRTRILSGLADAYAEIDRSDYDFGIFIAGPSKTADIEQSLVLGAHGPKTMTVVLLG